MDYGKERGGMGRSIPIAVAVAVTIAAVAVAVSVPSCTEDFS